MVPCTDNMQCSYIEKLKKKGGKKEAFTIYTRTLEHSSYIAPVRLIAALHHSRWPHQSPVNHIWNPALQRADWMGGRRWSDNEPIAWLCLLFTGLLFWMPLCITWALQIYIINRSLRKRRRRRKKRRRRSRTNGLSDRESQTGEETNNFVGQSTYWSLICKLHLSGWWASHRENGRKAKTGGTKGKSSRDL